MGWKMYCSAICSRAPSATSPAILRRPSRLLAGGVSQRIGTPLPASSPITSGAAGCGTETTRKRGEAAAMRSPADPNEATPHSRSNAAALAGSRTTAPTARKRSGRALATRRKKAARQPVPTSAKSHTAIETIP